MSFKKLILFQLFFLVIVTYFSTFLAYATNDFGMTNNFTLIKTGNTTDQILNNSQITSKSIKIEKIKMEDNEKTSNQTLRKEIQEYKNALNISPVVMVKINVVTKLVERKNNDKDNFENIVKTSKMINETEDKEILAEELLNMDRSFVNRFSQYLENRSKIKQQVNDYVKSVKLKKKARLQIRENMVEQLFNKKVTIDDFINQIWNET